MLTVKPVVGIRSSLDRRRGKVGPSLRRGLGPFEYAAAGSLLLVDEMLTSSLGRSVMVSPAKERATSSPTPGLPLDESVKCLDGVSGVLECVLLRLSTGLFLGVLGTHVVLALVGGFQRCARPSMALAARRVYVATIGQHVIVANRAVTQPY